MAQDGSRRLAPNISWFEWKIFGLVFVSRWLLGLASHRGFIVVVSWTVTTSVDHAPLCLTAVSAPMPLSGLFEWPRKSTQRWQTFGTLFRFEAVPFPMLLNPNCLVLGVNEQAIWSLQWMCWPLACLFCKASFQACACLPWHPTHGNSMKFWGLGCHPMLKQQSPARRHPTLCASGVVGLVPWWLHRAPQHSGAARTAQPAKTSRRPGHAVAPAPCDHWNWPLPLRLLPTSGSATTCNMQLREGGIQKLAGPKSIPWLPDMPKLAKPLEVQGPRQAAEIRYPWVSLY